MIETLVLAFGIGVVSGLRTFTSLAAVFLRQSGFGYAGIIMGVAALGEYVADLSPKIPSRTSFPSNAVRAVSGAIAAWFLTVAHGGEPIAGAIAGVVGAGIGTYGGHAARVAAIARLGAIPAGIAEDVVAIVLAAAIVTR
jgi:uncharacterized membrane protein